MGDRPADATPFASREGASGNGRSGYDGSPISARCNFDVIRSGYNVGGLEAGPHHVGPVPVIEGIGIPIPMMTGMNAQNLA